MLLSLDDRELFEAETALPVVALRDVGGFLTRLLYRLCWADSGSQVWPLTQRSAAVLQLMTTSMELCNQLYDRDCRRSFCPPGHWLWPAIQLPANDAMAAAIGGETPGYVGTKSGAMSASTSQAVLVLTSVPQVVPFPQRVALFQFLLERSKVRWAQRCSTRHVRAVLGRVHRQWPHPRYCVPALAGGR